MFATNINFIKQDGKLRDPVESYDTITIEAISY